MRDLGRLFLLTLSCYAAPLFSQGDGLDELPLPRWSQEDPQPMSGTVSLWPETYLREQSDGLGPVTGSAEDGGDLLFFIPKAPGKTQVAPAELAQPTPPQKLQRVSSDFLQTCENMEPGTYLIDPRQILHETQAEDLRRLLSYHASESRLSAYVLMLDKNESLPSTLDLSRLAAGRLTQGSTCLLVYPLGEPWRARFFMSRNVTQAVTPSYLSEIIKSCLQRSLQDSDSVEQLQSFVTQLSIRLIWLERAHPALFAAAEIKGPVVKTEVSSVWLPEVTVHAPVSLEAQVLMPKWKRYAVWVCWGVAATSGFFLIILLGLRAWRRRKRQSAWFIPEVEYAPRFGGPHCGGGGVSMKYH